MNGHNRRRSSGPLKVLVALAVACAAQLESLNGAASVIREQPVLQSSSTFGPAVEGLGSLVVDENGTPRPYEREEFGQRWADIDRNGCDQRNDVLARDLVDVVYRDGTRECVVERGVLADPYTGELVLFEKTAGGIESTTWCRWRPRGAPGPGHGLSRSALSSPTTSETCWRRPRASTGPRGTGESRSGSRQIRPTRPTTASITTTPTITVYGKPSCVQCDATYRTLDKRGIEYTIVDISQDAIAREYVMELGHLQAPVIVVGDQHWSGFRPDRIAAMAGEQHG